MNQRSFLSVVFCIFGLVCIKGGISDLRIFENICGAEFVDDSHCTKFPRNAACRCEGMGNENAFTCSYTGIHSYLWICQMDSGDGCTRNDVSCGTKKDCSAGGHNCGNPPSGGCAGTTNNCSTLYSRCSPDPNPDPMEET